MGLALLSHPTSGRCSARTHFARIACTHLSGNDGLSSGRSPDRLDALVYAVTELTTHNWHGPRIRAL